MDAIDGLDALAKRKASASAGNRTVFFTMTSLYSLVTALSTLFRFINPLTPELNLSAQRCVTRFFTGDFAS
jgi:hypothetical protein